MPPTLVRGPSSASDPPQRPRAPRPLEGHERARSRRGGSARPAHGDGGAEDARVRCRAGRRAAAAGLGQYDGVGSELACAVEHLPLTLRRHPGVATGRETRNLAVRTIHLGDGAKQLHEWLATRVRARSGHVLTGGRRVFDATRPQWHAPDEAQLDQNQPSAKSWPTSTRSSRVHRARVTSDGGPEQSDATPAQPASRRYHHQGARRLAQRVRGRGRGRDRVRGTNTSARMSGRAERGRGLQSIFVR